jgi:hypothetical protein
VIFEKFIGEVYFSNARSVVREVTKEISGNFGFSLAMISECGILPLVELRATRNERNEEMIFHK